MVDPPAAEPRAALFLLAQEVCDALPGGGGAREPLAAQHLEDVCGDVSAGLVDHLTEVAERDVAAKLAHVVGVEGPPTAVLALHPDRPLDAAFDRLFHVVGLRMPDSP